MKKLISFIALLIMMRVGALAATTTGTGTVTWGFGDGSTFKKTADPSEGIFESTTDLGISMGSNLTLGKESDTKNNHYYYTFKAGAATGNKKDANSVVTFTIKTANGVTFTPTSLTLKGSGRGTNGGTIDVEVGSGSTTKAVGTGWTFTREPAENVAVDAKTGTISGLKDVSEVNIKVYIYNLDAGKSFGINEISLSGTYTKTTTEKVTTITTASTSTLAGTTWDFTDATNFASLASAVSNALDGEWTTNQSVATTYEPLKDETTYYTPTLIKGLGIKGSADGKAVKLNETKDGKCYLILGSTGQLTIPGCQAKTIVLTCGNSFSVSGVKASANGTSLESSVNENVITYTLSKAGSDVAITYEGTSANPNIPINKIEVKDEFVTTRATTLSTSTAVGKKWDFAESDDWSSSLTKVKASTDEWKYTASNNGNGGYYDCTESGFAGKEKVEFNLDVLKGLQFQKGSNGGVRLNVASRDATTGKSVAVIYGTTLTIPGCEGKYVKFTGTDADQFMALTNATSKGGGVYEVTKQGEDVSFLSNSKNVYINSIEVLDVISSKTGSRTLTVENFLYKEDSGKGISSNDGGIDRTLRGVKLTFDGGGKAAAFYDKTKTDKEQYYLKLYKNDGDDKAGYMKMAFDDELPEAQRDHAYFTSVTFKSSSPLSGNATDYLKVAAEGWTGTLSTNSVTFSGPAAKTLRFDAVKTRSEDGFSFYQIIFDWAGDESWPADVDLKNIACTPTLQSGDLGTLMADESETVAVNVVPKNLRGVTYSSDASGVATVDAEGKVTVVGNGTATITTTWTAPSDNSTNYFVAGPLTSTCSVRGLDLSVGQEWMFNTNETHECNATDGGIAKDQDFSGDATLWALDKVDEPKNVHEYEYKKVLKSTYEELRLGNDVVAKTAGLFFSQGSAQQIKVNQNDYLRVSQSVRIKIKGLKAGDVVLVRCHTTNNSQEAGFLGENQENLLVPDADNAASKAERCFLLTAKADGDVVLNPSREMYIYRIKVYKRGTKLPYVNVTATRKVPIKESSYTSDYYYGYAGFKGLNANSQIAIIPHFNVGNTLTVSAQLWNVARSGKVTVADYAAEKNKLTGTGTWEYYSDAPDIASVDKSTGVITAKKGGLANIVAKYVPAAGENNSISYGYFNVYVNDNSSFRVALGDNYVVNTQVALPSGTSSTGDPVYVIDEENNKLDGKDIVLTLGGWDGKTDVRNPKNKDGWNAGRKDSYVTPIEGFNYAVNAVNDASDEEARTYGSGLYKTENDATQGVNELSKREVDNEFKGRGVPYRMPTRGGFLKFQPNKNGTLTVYIHQNGALDNDQDITVTNADGTTTTTQGYAPTSFHMRGYYISDEEGNLFSQNRTDDYKLTASTSGTLTKWMRAGDGLNPNYRKMADKEDATEWNSHKDEFEWFCNQYLKKADDNSNTNVKLVDLDSTKIDEYPDAYQGVYEHRGAQVTIDESMCKYTFHVKAGKTYFVFSLLTKVGFSGFDFKPDASFNATDTPELTAESETKFAYPSLAANTYHKVPNSFKKSLNQNQWNAVCLPFTMNEVQTKEAFGDDVEIIDLEDVDDHKITFKKHQYQMIIAGRPYLVWSSKSQMGIPTTPVSYDSQAEEPGKVQARSGNNYALIGNYAKIGLPKNCYVLNSKSVVLQNAAEDDKNTLKGYRAYINSANGSRLASKAFVISFGGIDEVVTGIQEVVADLANPQTSGNVYSLSGVKVSSKGLQNLPAGVYIMNGNKYVVK